MRLLNTSTLNVAQFIQSQVPDYAILSHTWEEEEVTLQDLQSGQAVSKKGFSKIQQCCRKAAEDHYEYCWIDTCCIDKSSSAELSEAINSMYQWYKNAGVCYAYLSDLKSPSHEKFRVCKWFSRGWTLQELIAPQIVEFYCADWTEYGTKFNLQQQIAKITRVSLDVLRGEDPSHHTVAERMSWASRRRTTRLEDEAYSLMGLFHINMPLLYGEGSGAFRRLQEAIMREEEDYTLLVWTSYRLMYMNKSVSGGLLAHSPSEFGPMKTFERGPRNELHELNSDLYSKSPLPLLASCATESVPLSLTSRGLHISLPIKPSGNSQGIIACLTTIAPHGFNGPTYLLCVNLHPQGMQGRYVRKGGQMIFRLSEEEGADFELKTIYVDQPPYIPVRISSKNTSKSLDEVVFVMTKISQDATIEHSLVPSTTIPDMQQILDLRISDADSSDDEARYVDNSPCPNESLVDAFSNLPDVILTQMATGDPKSCKLVEDNKVPNFLCCTIKNQPAVGFTISLDLKRPTPCFSLSLHHPVSRADSSSSATLIPIDFVNGVRTPSTSWHPSRQRDRATLHVDLKMHETLKAPSVHKTYEISISLRRVSSTAGVLIIKRFLLSVECRTLSTNLHQEEFQAIMEKLLVEGLPCEITN